MKPNDDDVRRSGRENYCGCGPLPARGRLRVKDRAPRAGCTGAVIGRCFVGPAEPAVQRV